MQYKILHSILKSCVDTCCFFFPPAGWIGPRVTLIRVNTEGGSNISIVLYILSRLNIFLLYLFGLIVLAFEYGRGVLKSSKPVKVGPSLASDDSQ